MAPPTADDQRIKPGAPIGQRPSPNAHLFVHQQRLRCPPKHALGHAAITRPQEVDHFGVRERPQGRRLRLPWLGQAVLDLRR